VKRTWFLAAALASALLSAGDGPYNEQADASADVQQALKAARADHRKVLLVFGANWCADCRTLDIAMLSSSRNLLEGRFEIVKIDVGNFDKNLPLAQRYGNPIQKGIPAAVVLDARGRVLYATRGGELVDARKMGEQGIYDFLVQKIAGRPASSEGKKS
jgi:thioredoxin 1